MSVLIVIESERYESFLYGEHEWFLNEQQMTTVDVARDLNSNKNVDRCRKGS